MTDQTHITRRNLCIGSASLGLLALTAGVWRYAPPRARELFISAQGDKPETFGLAWVDVNNLDAHNPRAQNLPAFFRGHGTAHNPVATHKVVMLARHPGNEAIEIDLNQNRILARFSCVTESYFEGHGCYSADGLRLFTSETHRQTGVGSIGIYDTKNWKKLGQMDSFGIEPHELKLMPDGFTLVVANGGLGYSNTSLGYSNASERTPNNLASMDSNLSYIDSRSGTLLEQVRLTQVPNPTEFSAEALSKASLRHIDIAADGQVAVAMQVQRDAIADKTIVPLAALHRRGEALQLLAHPMPVIAQLQDYMGSVAINSAAGVAGFTSPHGDLAVFWHLVSGIFAGYHELHDACGIAVSGDQEHFVLSNSAGQLRFIHALTLQENPQRRLAFAGLHWDNHLSIISTRPPVSAA
ncbi:MAG: DUF1513 domain-containing protein [Marinagarivorans sp.]|nr:DUF1513 domain-containing protein [Marinagarivorans sp.]